MLVELERLTIPLRVRPLQPVTDSELQDFSRLNETFKIERNREGELVIMTPVGATGGNHEMYVCGQLWFWAEKSGGVAFSPNTGFNLPDGSCLAPDGAWLRQERWDALTKEQQRGYPPVCPDFLMEVRSQSDPRRLLEAKMLLWMENGARLAWLIDPVEGVFSIYRPGEPVETLERPELVAGHGPVEGFTLKTARLWEAERN